MRLLWALLLVLAASANALAQDYPTRNVIFVVPTGAGAATDLLARILAPQLGDRLGKPFVVEDRPGAGTLTLSGVNTFGGSGSTVNLNGGAIAIGHPHDLTLRLVAAWLAQNHGVTLEPLSEAIRLKTERTALASR